MKACYYCGVPAESIDHVPPRSARPTIIALNLEKKYPFVEVHACLECNSILGARALWRLKERKDFIKKALKKKYRKHLQTAVFTDAELSEYGYNLKTYLVSGEIMRRIVRQRLAW